MALTTAGGNGGAGTASSITGSSVTRAGGGGGGYKVQELLELEELAVVEMEELTNGGRWNSMEQ
jgi:hypothetical protein